MILSSSRSSTSYIFKLEILNIFLLSRHKRSMKIVSHTDNYFSCQHKISKINVGELVYSTFNQWCSHKVGRYTIHFFLKIN